MALTDKLIAIADAIRGKTGGTDKLTLDEMASEIEGITTGGGDDVAKGIIERTITEISDSTVTKVGDYAFYYCSALKRVNLPAATSLGQYAFQSCIYLASVNLPAVKIVGTSSFRECSRLENVAFPAAANIYGSAFYSCGSLSVLALAATSVCTLQSTSAFTGTPFASGGTGGTVYVPEALIESYQTATNWSTLYNAGTCNFVAIEGSEYE